MTKTEFVLVPRTITPEMARALESNYAECMPASDVHVANWREAYAAMLAAAPEPELTAEPVMIGYTNWRGEYAEREIIPLHVWFGSTDWHPDPQWLLKATDVAKGAERDFAVKDIGIKATPTPEPQPEVAAWRWKPDYPAFDWRLSNGPNKPEPLEHDGPNWHYVYEPLYATPSVVEEAVKADDDGMLSALQDLHAFVAIMVGRGPNAAIPETINAPLGVPIKIGDIMRNAQSAIRARSATP